MTDRNLSPHFTLFDLTRTDHVDLQETNRNVTNAEELRLGEVANLLETCRTILGCDLDVHSARRFLELNKRVGGSERSQHLKSEAADFSPAGPDTESSVTNAWQKLVTASRVQSAPGYVGTGILKFGQLILESDKGLREGRVWWIHVSLGSPYRDAARCGQVATSIDGKFTMISRVL